MYIFGQEYIDYLQSNLARSKVVSGGRELQTRCKDCPDSSDPGSHGHMYISIPQSEEEVSLYDCKKCGSHGLITPETLMKWGIYQEGISIGLYVHNKKALANRKNFKYLDREVYILRNYYIRKSIESEMKLGYINNRIGTNLSMRDVSNLKICLNLGDVIDQNHIQELSRHKNIVQQLDKNFLGFISADNAFINLRKVTDTPVYEGIEKRYVNYNIFGKFSNTERFYTVPTSIDLMRLNRPLELHIAEGPFDILSIYQNLRTDIHQNAIFSSVSGSGYMGVIQHFISKIKLPYLEVHIYPDNDKQGSDTKMQYITDDLRKIGIPVYIHRNRLGKDFGVSLKGIDEMIYQL